MIPGRMSVPDAIRVAIVEDDRATREGLRLLIDRAAGYRCIAAFRSAEDALQRNLDVAPDVLLVDIQLPGMSGTELVGRIRSRDPAVAILMLTAYGDDNKVFASICAGAQGYLLKKTPPAQLLASIAEAHAGGSPISPEIARKVLDAFRRASPPRIESPELTPHEVRLLALLAEGHSYEAAGRELGISVNTVRSYVRSSYEKLQVHSKSAAVVKAIRRGIL